MAYWTCSTGSKLKDSITFFNLGIDLLISPLIAASYCAGVMLAAIPDVSCAKNFFAPPFTPRRFTIACCSILGITFAKSLKPEALSNTPAVPTSAKTLPDKFGFCKSLSPLRVDATNCLIISDLLNLPLMAAILGSYGDSITINFLCPVGSVGSIIVLIVCFGDTSP